MEEGKGGKNQWAEVPPLDAGWRGEKKETIYSFHDRGRELLLLSSLLPKPGLEGFLIF